MKLWQWSTYVDTTCYLSSTRMADIYHAWYFCFLRFIGSTSENVTSARYLIHSPSYCSEVSERSLAWYPIRPQVYYMYRLIEVVQHIVVHGKDSVNLSWTDLQLRTWDNDSDTTLRNLINSHNFDREISQSGVNLSLIIKSLICISFLLLER